MKIRYWLILAVAVYVLGSMETQDFNDRCTMSNGVVLPSGDCSK